MINHALVLVPALGSDQRLWAPLVERIGNRVTTTVIRGAGTSIEEMADSVLSQAPEQFYLAGNSMGGYVSLEVALRETGRVKGLALLNSSAIAAPPDRRGNSIRLIDMAQEGRFAEAVAGISKAVAPSRPEISSLAEAMALDLGAEVFKDQQLAVLERSDRREEIIDLPIPTLVIGGTADGIVPPELSEELAKLIPNAELTLLDGVGHLSSLEAPDEVAALLLGWLERISH